MPEMDCPLQWFLGHSDIRKWCAMRTLRGYTGLIASSINAIPVMLLKIDRIQAMKIIRRTIVFDRQPLVTKPRRNGIGP